MTRNSPGVEACWWGGLNLVKDDPRSFLVLLTILTVASSFSPVFAATSGVSTINAGVTTEQSSQCDFQARIEAGDSLHLAGRVSTTSLLVRGTKDFDPSNPDKFRPWRFCGGPDFNGGVAVRREQGDERKAVVQEGNRIRIAGIVANQYSEKPSNKNKYVWFSSSCDAQVNADGTSSIDCTLGR